MEVKNKKKEQIQLLQKYPNFDYKKVNNYGKQWAGKDGRFYLNLENMSTEEVIKRLSEVNNEEVIEDN